MSSGAFTDSVTAVSDAPYGQGSGTLTLLKPLTGQIIVCNATMLNFCGDEAVALWLDPASQNVFFPDGDTNEVLVGHIDFSTSQLLPTTSVLPGSPTLVFSPDSKLLYAGNLNNIDVYAWDAESGRFTASSSIPRHSNTIYLTAATLTN